MATPQLPDRPPVGDLYPRLPAEFLDIQNFRRLEVRRVRDFLEQEIEYHTKAQRRRKRTADTLSDIGTVASSVALACSASAIGTLAGGITAPASLALGGVAFGVGVIGSTCSVLVKIRTKRIQQYEPIVTAAETRNDTISSVVSKAMVDNDISQDEFIAVLRQAELYRVQKRQLLDATRRPGGLEKVKKEKAKNELKARVTEEVNRQLGR